jgi:hypothetical protein
MCSTRESRYAKRKAERVCPQCGMPAIIKGKQEYGGGWVCFKKKDGCGAKFRDDDASITGQVVGTIENPDLPDSWNTVVKMSEKRARVDAVLAVTGASALFTQDVEDAGPVEPPQARPRPPAPPRSDVTDSMPWDDPGPERGPVGGPPPSSVDTTGTMTAERIMGDESHDVMPAQDLLGEMKRQGMNVGQVRELLAQLEIQAPDDLRSVETRSRFFGDLGQIQRIAIAKALVERAKVPA